MNQFLIYFLSIYLWNLSCGYSIQRFLSTPPQAKYGFNPIFVQQQDEIGTYFTSYNM